MAATKVANYSPEQTAELVAAYNAVRDNEAERVEVVSKFAEKFGKTVKSVVAKLTVEKVYVAKAYKTKTGAKPEKKDTTADAIGAILRLSENDTSSLAKANKTALQAVFNALANSKPIDGDE